ncbi:MAG TPA: hypothetical protein VND21_02600, partial [Planctomycetota bacterium]|nr:hypothetical protein [Planctomycetota bacterium]
MTSSGTRWGLFLLAVAIAATVLLAAGPSLRPWAERSPASVTGTAPPSIGVGADEAPVREPGTGLSAPPAVASGEAGQLAVSLVSTDPAGRPVPGVVVEVVAADSEPETAAVLATGSTDESGALSLRLDRGAYRARCRHSDWHGDAAEFDVPAERPVPLRMMRGIRLRVRVEDAATRRPLSGAVVREIMLGWGQAATTDAEGIADLGAIHGTWARVLAGCEGYLSEAEWANGLAKGSTKSPLVLRLAAARPLEIDVLREGTREPEVGAAIYVRHVNGRAEGLTDVEGRCRLEAALAEPDVSVRATTRDGREGVVEILGA